MTRNLPCRQHYHFSFISMTGPATSTPATTIAIIGAGLSGTLVAANLLRMATAPLRIVLIERRGQVGQGVAYGTICPDHLLNVPAGRMGAWPDRPEHFLDWLRAHQGEPGIPGRVSAEDFLPRGLYGVYLGRVLVEARAAASVAVEFVEIEGEVVDIEEREGGGGVLKFADEKTLGADLVVFAVGNLPGEYPIPRPLPVYRSKRYVHIPWSGDALEGIGAQDEVLLVGQGLTAVDLIVQLDRAGHRGTIHALSRHGHRLTAHQPVTQAYAPFLRREAAPTTIRALVRRVREEIEYAGIKGIDWRAVIDGLRPYSPAIWQSLSWEERARFMRHVRPFWEIHRHRLAPATAAVIERLVAEGRLKFYAGRLQVLEADATGVHALFRRRRSIQHVGLRVAKVINCTGPRTDYSKYQHPLFIHLLARGLIDHDPLALGINALPSGEVLRYRGGPTGWLFTLGAPMKGQLWETTAAPEIRGAAQQLAKALLGK
jgi:uncharacterized NAD(P)/FAD-binding protein YdhS